MPVGFLSINGTSLRVSIGKANRTLKRRGRRDRAYRGQQRDGTRGKRPSLVFTTVFEDRDLAETLIRIINGEGHLVTFRSGWDANTSLIPEIGLLADTRFDRLEGPFPDDLGSLFVGGDTLIMRYDAQLLEEHTIHFWTKVTGDVWKPHTFRSDGVAYDDGVRDDSAFNGFGTLDGNVSVEVRDGRVEIAGLGGDETWISQLGMLPGLADTSVIAGWHAATKAWGGNPVLRVEGDALLTDHELFFGEVTGTTIIGKHQEIEPFGWFNNAQIVEFKLDMVADFYVSDDTVPT